MMRLTGDKIAARKTDAIKTVGESLALSIVEG